MTSQWQVKFVTLISTPTIKKVLNFCPNWTPPTSLAETFWIWKKTMKTLLTDWSSNQILTMPQLSWFWAPSSTEKKQSIESWAQSCYFDSQILKNCIFIFIFVNYVLYVRLICNSNYSWLTCGIFSKISITYNRNRRIRMNKMLRGDTENWNYLLNKILNNSRKISQIQNIFSLPSIS